MRHFKENCIGMTFKLLLFLILFATRYKDIPKAIDELEKIRKKHLGGLIFRVKKKTPL